MNVGLLLVLILFPFHVAGAATGIRCDSELKELKTFASRESAELKTRLANVQTTIARLPKYERIRAKVLWTEAEASRTELEKTLNKEESGICAQVNEDIRAHLFRAQEFAFDILFKYDDRVETASLKF